ncbi:MAG: YraN family protein [Bacteroidetes bacterium]|nr:YraN family protein [Bacteroidota bacterium]
MIRNLDVGNKGENVATEYLLQNGYTIIERNWRYKHWEIDIICSRNKKLHFVEVKTRTNKKFGNPEESINESKMNALKKGAEMYLLQNEQWTLIQFDVVAITMNKEIIEEIFFIEDVFF